jgi:Na+/melibiose symporter-like transporter
LTFISRLTLVLTALTQLAVQTTTGFIPDIAAVQPASAIAGLKLTLSLFPPLALFLGLLVFVRFPLTKREVPGIRARLEEIHAEKRKKLEEMLQAKANKAP